MQIEPFWMSPREVFEAKDFDEQQSYRFGMHFGSKAVEVGLYLHWHDGSPVDVAIDLSCMAGCSQHCCFCAAAKVYDGTLSAAEITSQAHCALDHLRAQQDNFFEPNQRKKITFSFEGMGEPTLASEEVATAISLLREDFASQFDTQFLVSTIAVRPEEIHRWVDSSLQSLQFSLHATTQEVRRRLLSVDTPIESMFNELKRFHASSPQTQIKVNYLLLPGVNDSDDDVTRLAELVAGTDYYVKISLLNETPPALANEMKRATDDATKQFREKLEGAMQQKDRTYVYGTARQIGMSCGELASYATATLTPDDDETVMELFEHIRNGDASLFLGAGASRTAWNASELAEELYEALRYDSPFSDTALRLDQIVDLYEAKSQRFEVEHRIKNSLENAKHPIEYERIPEFDWRSIYTTNYDRFVERAYETAAETGRARKRCVVIKETGDLCELRTRGVVPLVKLHGCITQGVGRLVLSSYDYLSKYRDEHEFLFKLLQLDSLSNVFVFAGYSFQDQHIAELIFQAKRAASRAVRPSYAIAPRSALSGDMRHVLKEKFRVKLIQCTFADVMKKWATMSRLPTIFVTGSVKTHRRDDVRADAERFAKVFGEKMTEENVRIVTGASATDKMGYLIAKNMDEKLVTTYVYDANREERQLAQDDIEKMIGRRSFGFDAHDVIEKCLNESQFVVIVGGSGMTLEEFQAANVARRIVIPVPVGSAEYASDIAHAYYTSNLEKIKQHGQDRGFVRKQRSRQDLANYLTQSRLARLSLKNPEETVDVILEIIRAFRVKEAPVVHA